MYVLLLLQDFIDRWENNTNCQNQCTPNSLQAQNKLNVRAQAIKHNLMPNDCKISTNINYYDCKTLSNKKIDTTR